VRSCHERWDGDGYPDGLRGDVIPLGARIVGLVDAYDAIIHDRPYRPARSIPEALEEIHQQSGKQFDPALVALFVPLAEHDGLDRTPQVRMIEALRAAV
jgi:putative two-component system response regulator